MYDRKPDVSTIINEDATQSPNIPVWDAPGYATGLQLL